MNVLALRIALTPALIGMASLVGRRWGPGVSGWLIGLPLTSGPIIFFLALGHGTDFAAAAATGTLSGTFSEITFCLAYSWVARRSGWQLAIVASFVAFFTTTAGLQYVTLPAAILFPAVIVALTLALRLMPPRAPSAEAEVHMPWWDLPTRMIIATSFVVALTTLAPLLGPHLTGLLAPVPLYGAILVVFAHHFQGADAALNFLRGLLLGLFSFVSFFCALVVLLDRIGIAAAFVSAILVALAMQGVSLWVMQSTSE